MQIIIANVGPQGPPGPAGAGPIIAVNDTQSPYTLGTISAIYTIYNRVANPFAITLPAVPGIDQTVTIVDASLTAAGYPININGNGNQIVAYGARLNTLSVNSTGGSITMSWDGTQWTQTA